MAFSEGDDIKGVAIDSLEGGVSAFAGIYIFDKFLAAPIEGALKSAGKYALPAAGLVVDIALNYISRHVGEGGVIGEGLRVAGYAALGKSIATYIGDPTPMGGAAAPAASSQNWGSLGSHTLSFGAEVGY